jgi:hypothetical protein
LIPWYISLFGFKAPASSALAVSSSKPWKVDFEFVKLEGQAT